MQVDPLLSETQAWTVLPDKYISNVNAYDELLTPSGEVRTHWQAFLDNFSRINPQDQQFLAKKLNRLVYENGLAHDVFADPDGTSQPWQIDLIPVIISASEWQWLSKAIRQRARLYNTMLQDLYGPQNLMKSGQIPARMVFSDTSFLKPCMNLYQDHDPLYFFSIDIARNSDGSWRAIDCHSETPAGLGFAIANRIVHNKVLGEIFDTCKVEREASFFQGILSHLPEHIGVSDPNIAVLTHGSQHGDYFSHAYLARYLGYRLVEGSDLRVVGENIFLKTLLGLMPIDGIIRCIEGELSDPLELSPSGFLGPAHFVQASRKNPKLIANTLGSSIIENRGLSAHLPQLCQSLLGEDLLLHDAQRFWLGDQNMREMVLNETHDYIIRPIREGTGRPGVADTGQKLLSLPNDSLQSIFENIRLKGEGLIAEQVGEFASSPSWNANGFAPTPYGMRLFAVRQNDDYVLLPGGIAMTVNPETSVALNAPEGLARDVWVLTDKNKAHQSLLKPNINPKTIDRNNGYLPSRIADNLFWLGRYVERTEWTMRLMRSALIQTEEERGVQPDVDAIRKTLEILITKEGTSIQLPSEELGHNQINELIRILRSSNVGTFGLKGALERILYVSQLIRDRLSLEAWEALNSFKANPLWWQDAVPIRTDDSIDLLNEGIRTLAAFSGIVRENMTRNYGWRFLEIGRRLERALNHCEVLHMLFVDQPKSQNETSRLFFMLKLADSLITYRSRYRFAPDLSLVLDLLIIDENNPRGLCFQLSEMMKHINLLPQSADDAVRTEEQKIILELNTEARLLNMTDVVKIENSRRPSLAKALEHQIQNLPILSEVLSRRYFSLTDELPHRLHSKPQAV
ncbi:MAG: circularly permuted type 2 ATP-grasp protein [Pseudomonadota bacterium]